MPAVVDAAMLEMFRSEAELHLAALNEGLLALERSPGDRDRFETLMRAAHSIKGAAKIVGLPAAVQIAHAIEDCFVVAGKGHVEMHSALVDELLAGVDLLGRAAEVDDAGRVALDPGDPSLAAFAARLANAMSGSPALAPSSATLPGGHVTRSGRTIELRAPARLDRAWATEVRGQIASSLAIEGGHVRLNLCDVTQADAVSLALLTLSVSQSKKPGTGGFQLHGALAEIEHILRAVGLGEALER